MSRTDKDNPWWVRAEYYEPFHNCGWVLRNIYEKVERTTDWGWTYNTYRKVRKKWEYLGDCNLPEVPVRSGQRLSRKKYNERRCMWTACWPNDYNMQLRGKSVKRACHTEYHGPQRAAVRDAAREVIKGNHEYEFPDGRTRHSVLWDLS